MGTSTKDRIRQRFKAVEEKKDEKSSSSSSSLSTKDRIEKAFLEKKIGLDTFESDLARTGETINKIYGGWHTADTMNQTKGNVQNMQSRLNALHQYQRKYGSGVSTELDSIMRGYQSVLDEWDNLSSMYGYYENADAFRTARKQAEMESMFKVKTDDGERGLTFDEVQERLKQYSPDSDEYKYLSAYTGYTDLNDFDKAIEALKRQGTVPKINKLYADKQTQSFNDRLAQEDADITNAQRKESDMQSRFDGFANIGKGKAKTPMVANGGAIQYTGESSEPSDYLRELETKRNQLELDHAFDRFSHIMQEEDFAEKSQYVSTKSDKWHSGLTSQYGLGFDDITYEYINNVDGIRDEIKHQASIYGMDTGDGVTSMEKKGYDKLYPEEIAVYNYLYNYDKEHKTRKAKEFLDSMEVTLTKRVYGDATSEWEKSADSSAVASTIMSALSVPANIMGSITGTVESVGDALAGKEYNPYGYYKMPSNFSADTREYVGEDIAEATEGMELFGQNIPSFLYQTGMSIADSAVGATTFGSAFSPIMGMSAFQQRAKELKEAGASENEVISGAMASGIFEMAFEKLSLDNLLKAKNADSLLKVIKESAKQAGIEGVEEFGTEVANILFDNISRGKESDAYKKYEDYLARGFSEKEAERKVKQELNAQIGWAFVGGALSGGTMGFGASVNNYSGLKATGEQIRANDRTGDMWELSAMTPQESVAREAYERYAERGINADNISNAQLGNLYATAEAEAIEALRSKKSTDVQKANAETTLKGLKVVSTVKQSKITSSGEALDIKGVKTVDGETVIVTNDGEVSAKDATLSLDDARKVAYAQDMDEAKAEAFIAQYDGKTDIDSFAQSFELAYAYGEALMDESVVFERKGVLTEAQALEAYKAGVKGRNSTETIELQKALDEINKKYSSKTFVKGVFDDSIIDYTNSTKDGSKVNWRNLTKTQRNAVTFAKAFSEATGVNIKFIQSKVVNGGRVGENGSYNPATNTIEIDVYAGIMDATSINDSIIPTVAHEVTHWMKNKSPVMYASMRDFILETLTMDGKNTVNDLIAQRKAKMEEAHKGTKVTDEDAIDEIVARGCEDMLSNSNEVRKMLNRMSVKEQNSFIAKVKETFKNLMDWVNELLSQYKSNSKEARVLREYKDRLKELSKMWDKALKEAIQTNQSLQAEGIADAEAINSTLNEIGLEYDAETETVYSMRSLEDAFDYNEGTEAYMRARAEYVDALVKATGKTKAEANRYLDSLFLVHDMIANDQARLDYESAINKSAWVSNSEYGGSIDFSTLCAKRRLFTGTMDAIHEALPDAVLNENDFLLIRNMLLEKDLESPCSMCYMEGSRAKADMYIKQWLDEYNATNPEWKPRMRDFASATRLEQTRINHPEAYKAYQEAMNKLAQRKPKEASVRTDYKGEILVAFEDGTSVKIKNENGGIRFNSFSDFEIIHALDCMQVITDMARVGLAGQGYTKVKEFAECFGKTGLKINLSLVAKGVDKNGKLIFDEVNGMKYSDAMELRSKYSKNVGTVIVAFTNEQIKSALADPTIDYVLPFHRSQWKKSQYTMMGLPVGTKDYTNVQNDRINNPQTGRAVKLSKIKAVTSYTNKVTGETYEIKDNIMPNMYWDYSKSGRENAQEYLNYINDNRMTPKFQFLLQREGSKWVLPEGAVGDGYFKLLIDFKMYDNKGVGSPQMPVVPEFNMGYIQQMLDGYTGGHQSFPVANDVVDKFVEQYQKKQYSERDVNVKNARELTESDFRDILEDVYNGVLDNGTYIPMRANTPQIFIDVVEWHSKGKVKVMNLPMASSVEHVYQNMEEDDGTSYGNKRPHGFDADDMVTIAEKMSDPQYIVLQKNGRYAEVVSFRNKRNKKVVVSIDIATSNTNYKYTQQMNGYNEGYYNIIVTEYEPDSLDAYLGECTIVYDKKKNESNQVGLGRVMSVTHDSPFFNPNDSTDLGNGQGIQFSDRDYGYHAGDLGKAEGYMNMMSSNRGTGHFGTGTYFVGDEQQLTGNYAKRPKEKVNFSKYNLYKPESENYGFKLHEALKAINRMILTYPLSEMTFEERYAIKKGMDDAGYALWRGEGVEEAIAYLEDIRQKCAWLVDRDLASKSADELTTDDYEAFADKYEELYKALGDIDSDFRRLAFDVQTLFSYRKEAGDLNFDGVVARHKRILQEVYDESVELDAKWDTNYTALMTEDSPSTRYMKKWGYEGIDVRRFKGLDNTAYGSVIYDLKGEDLARKQEIGTAKFSDRENETIYDIMGETESLKKQNDLLKADIEALKERLKLERQVTRGNTFNAKQLKAVAKHLKNLAKSDYSEDALVEELREVYSYIVETPQLDWEVLMSKSYDVARRVLEKTKGHKVTNDYFKAVLADIRKTRISLSEEQIQEAKSAYGEKYRNAFMGRVMLTKNGISLDQKWQELAEMYPEIFDASVTGGDQIIALSEIYDALHEGAEVYQKYNDTESIRAFATEIYNQYWNVSTIQTTADKYDKQIKRINYEHRKAMSELRENYKNRRTADAEHYRKIISNVRQQRDEARKLGRKRVDEYKERLDKKAKINSIKSKTLRLKEMLLKNSKDKHISEDLKPMVRSLVQAIDYETSSRDVRMFESAGISLSLTEAESALIGQSTKAVEETRQKITMLDALYKVQRSFGTMDFYGISLEGEIEEIIDSLEALKEQNHYPLMVLNAMSLEQLETINKLVGAVSKVVSNANNLHTKRRNLTADNLGGKITSFLDKLGVGKVYRESIEKYMRTFKWLHAVPYYAFKRLGEGGIELFSILQDGWDKLAFNVRDILLFAEEAYTKKEVKEWSKEAEQITVGDTTFRMTYTQIMSLYCLWNREQGRKHILGNGIRVGNFDSGVEVVNQPKNIKVTQKDVEAILSQLSDRQIAVADKIREFMNGTCKDWGNYISMERFGFEAFTEENYFPIEVDDNNLSKDKIKDNKNISLYALLNMGFTKSLNEHSKNAIVINDIFDVFANHASEMAKYNALGLAVLDFNRVMNYSEDREGQPYSIRTAMETAYGKDAEKYFNKLIADLNGTQSVSRDTLGKGMMSKAKLGAIGWNIKTALLQPTAYFKAVAVLSRRSLINSVVLHPHLVKRGMERAEKHCGLALWKSLGYYDTNISRGVVDKIKHNKTLKDNLAEKSTKWMEKADAITIGALWNACELEVKNTRKDLDFGSKEFFEVVADKLREVIYATQVVDSTLTRSEMMRSGDTWDKVLTAFGSESILAYNMLLDSVMETSILKRSGATKEALRDNRRKVARVLEAYTVTNIVTAILEAVISAFREEDELEEGEMIKMMLQNFASNMSVIGKIPYLKDIVSIFSGYSPSRLDTQGVQSLYYALKSVQKNLEGEGSVLNTFRHLLKAYSSLEGLGFWNAYKDAMALLDFVGVLSTEELEELLNEILE